jgi:RNA polymerase sigma factor (sigma-70 family)
VAFTNEARKTGIRDSRLIEAVRAGDARAFELLYERHHPPILSFCRHMTGRLEDAEDAVQHTFLSAYSEISGSSGQLELRPWLFTVARNRCLTLLRARRVREGPAAGALWTGRHGPPEERAVRAWGVEGLAEEVERREELRTLVSDLGELPEPQRAALVLSELEALSHAQIARVLEVDTAKVRSLVFQARGSLISTREARDTPCGEVRMQLSTLRGSSLRRRTLRRHVRQCAGCREYEAAVRGQRRDLALILPVTAGAGLRDSIVSAAVSGGAVGGGVAAGGVAGAALTGGAAVGGTSGVLGGLAGLVAGSGVAQFTAVVAVAATGTVGVAKTHMADRLGITGGGQLDERRAEAPFANAPAGLAPAGEADAPEWALQGPGGGGEGWAPPGLGKNGRDGTPPGLAKKGDDWVPPGLAKKGDDWVPPGQRKKGGDGTPPGLAKKAAGGVAPGQAKKAAGGGSRGAAGQPHGQGGKQPGGGNPSDHGNAGNRGGGKPSGGGGGGGNPSGGKPSGGGNGERPAAPGGTGQGNPPANPGSGNAPKPQPPGPGGSEPRGQRGGPVKPPAPGGQKGAKPE